MPLLCTLPGLLILVLLVAATVTGQDPERPVVLWLTKYICWETDHLLEIFHPDEFEHIASARAQGRLPPSVSGSRVKVVVYNILNAGKDATYSEVRSVVASYPSVNILVHLSDEWQGTKRKWRYGEGVELYHLHPQLVLRQHSPFPYSDTLGVNMSKVMTLPLGYFRGMIFPFTNRTVRGNDEPPLKIPFAPRFAQDGSNRSLSLHSSSDVALLYSSTIRTADRYFNWTHVGELGGHGDRKKALRIFQSWHPHKSGRMSAPEMFNLYLRSRFVPVGRGQLALDCFRIYEAIIAGAVPVVVGDDKEIQRTFNFSGSVGLEMPPAVFKPTWEEALNECRNMSEAQIDKRRAELASWYAGRMQKLRERARAAAGINQR